MYYCCGISDSGTIREHNEDAFLISHIVGTDRTAEKKLRSPFIVAVADGVAGEAKGEVASKLALKMLSCVRPDNKTDYHNKIMDIHKKLKNYGMRHSDHSNMQTTLCALAVNSKNEHFLINVGDSRLYRVSDGYLRQLSTDQSLVQMLYANGHITAEEKINHKNRNMIMPVLGNMSSDPVPQIIPIEPLRQGELILICSDGLSDYLTVGEFEDILAMPMNLPKRLSKLVQAAEKNGSSDNITVLALSPCSK